MAGRPVKSSEPERDEQEAVPEERPADRLRNLLSDSGDFSALDPEGADRLAAEVMELASRTGGADEIRAVLAVGRHHLSRFRAGKAREILQGAVPAAEENAGADLQHELHQLLTRACFKHGAYPDALRHARRALILSRTLGRSDQEIVNLTWAGAALTQLGRYMDALEHLYAAVDLGDQRPEAASVLARALNYLGLIHEELGNFERAFAYHEQALAHVSHRRDPQLEGRILAKIGEAYHELGRGARAREYLSRGRELLESEGDRAVVAWCELVLGRIEQRAGNARDAGRLFRRARDLARQSDSGRIQAETEIQLGCWLMEDGRLWRARRVLGEGLRLAESIGVDRERARAHQALAEVAARQWRWRRAWHHQKTFQSLWSRVTEEVVRTKTVSLSAEFELRALSRHGTPFRPENRPGAMGSTFEDLKALHDDLQAQTRRLRELTIRDSLTGLYNRRHLDQELASALHKTRSRGRLLAIAFIDVDRFKGVNDRFSHSVGDRVLRRLADLFRDGVRHDDMVARYGGEEFVILFPDTDREECRRACEKLRATVEEAEWPEIAPGFRVTVSGGIADSSEAVREEDLLALADRRLFQAKRRGRNRFF